MLVATIAAFEPLRQRGNRNSVGSFVKDTSALRPDSYCGNQIADIFIETEPLRARLRRNAIVKSALPVNGKQHVATSEARLI